VLSILVRASMSTFMAARSEALRPVRKRSKKTSAMATAWSSMNSLVEMLSRMLCTLAKDWSCSFMSGPWSMEA